MNSRLLDRNLNSKPQKFKEHRLYKTIEDAGRKHKSRFNMGFAYRDLLKIIENIPVTKELEDILKKSYENAQNNVDKRPMNKQRQVRDKWQPTHGLVFKNIPENIPRQVVYDAITKNLGTLKRDNNQPMFQGGLKIRNFNWPNRSLNGLRNIFPVFVSQKDRDTLLKWASMQDYHIQLEIENHPDHPEYDVLTDPWDRLILVELPRSVETGEFHGSNKSDIINILPKDQEIEPRRTKPAEYYGAHTPPSLSPTSMLPSVPNSILQNPLIQNPVIPQTTVFNPVDINSFSLPSTPPMMYPSGASSPMSMNSDMMMNYQMNLTNRLGNQLGHSFSSNTSSPLGPYSNPQLSNLPLDIQNQQLTQQFSQVSTKETDDVLQEALGRVSEIEQAKGHFSENDSKDEIVAESGENKASGDGNSTPISEKLASDEMD